MSKSETDIRQKRFGRLVAVNRYYDESKENVHWKCVCNCGKEVVVRKSRLIDGTTQSCGCLKNDLTSQRSWKGHGEISSVYWYDLSRNAKYRCISMNISIEEAWQLFLVQERKCFLTGEELFFNSRKNKDGNVQTASLDRIDNSLGYTVENCCWIHKRVNRLKNDFSVEELLYWSSKLVNYKNESHDKSKKNSTTSDS